MENYFSKTLYKLAMIKRFPPISLWFDYNEIYFKAECSPSFEEVVGQGDSPELAVEDLVNKLKPYLTTVEKNELENLKEEKING